MAKPKMQTITRKDWDKKHKDFKLIGKDKIPYIMVYDNGTKLIPVKIIEGEMEESVASAIDQIRQDSKDIRDFLKKVFSDSDFRAMKNDKDFVQYLKSIYEGVSVNETIDEGKKRFYQQDGIGRAKYTISYHDGKSKHKDGSDFYGIQIIKNKKELEKFRSELLKKGYREDSGFKKESVNEARLNVRDLGSDVLSGPGDFEDWYDAGMEVRGKKKLAPISKSDEKKLFYLVDEWRESIDDKRFGNGSSADIDDIIKAISKFLTQKGKVVNESVNEGLKHNDMYTMLDIAAGYSSTQDQAANQMWSDEQDLYDYLKSDHIPKKYHKKFHNDIKRRFKNIKESVVNEAKEPEVITQLRKIVKDSQNDLIKDTKSGKKVRVDMNSADLMVQVYDALKKQSNKDKFVKSGIAMMGHTSYKLMLKKVDVSESGVMYKAGVKKYGKEGMTKIQSAAGKGEGHEEIGKIKDKYDKSKNESVKPLKTSASFSEVIKEAEYQGRKVELNKPMQGDTKKFKVYVKNDKGNVVKVNFGQKGMVIKKDNPGARKSFRARMNCDTPGPKWKARYWSCRKW